jgi:replication factor C subunit 2/4
VYSYCAVLPLTYRVQVKFNDEGLQALIFTAEGDMRQAINNLQSTWSGFGFVSQDNVFKICDQPHPIMIRRMLKDCQKGSIDDALARVNDLWDQGYSAVDIVVTIFRVVKSMEDLPEYTKLEFIRVSHPFFLLCFLPLLLYVHSLFAPSGSTPPPTALPRATRASSTTPDTDHQEIGWTHMRILEGVGTIVQLGAMIARLCRHSIPPDMLKL